jgi:cytochrome b6-f complex iron-sulfur subunit
MSDAAKPAPGATTAPPAAPPATPKPPAKPAKSEGRRWFLRTSVQTAWTAFSAAMFAMLLYSVRFMWPNASNEPPMSFKAGEPKDFPLSEVVERFKADFGVWIVRLPTSTGSEIIALSTTCTHLGCTPNWLQNEQKFKCPCHGSGFHKDGVNFEGPAPRPLERYKISVGGDGQIVVDKSRKFQKELGQWSDPESFLTAT